MFYRVFRAVVSLALRLFFRIDAPVDPHGGLALDGPVIYVGNHPNGLVDPGLLFILVRRHVTFLAKAPLFRMPVLGWILRGLDALPVFRKQDAGQDMKKNEGTLAASADALVAGRAITIFPEGKSHSEPQLAELKTGCARIALDAALRGARVRIVPVGITYEEKNTFKSHVHVEVGPALSAADFAEGEHAREAVRKLTEAIADALEAVTLNLEAWEDLPILETAEALYALEKGDRAGDAERQKAFARGMALLREEQPARFEALKAALRSFRQRLDLVQVTPRELTFRYRPATVAWFIVRNLLWLFGLPAWLVGMALFTVPYWIPVLLVRATKVEKDTESTVKVLTLMLLAPLWWALLTGLAWWQGGLAWGVAALVGVPPLALFTRYFFERRRAALRNARLFLVLGSRARLKAALLREGNALAVEIAQVADELRPRVVAA
ncbi:MAG: lysophospholipid acyltransferase family protein [Myxococcota bacterium]|jgi:1-acyl-sn-glycerol-3-phosphate acyltransferase